VVRAAGDFDYSRTFADTGVAEAEAEQEVAANQYNKPAKSRTEQQKAEVDIASYRPDVRDRTWYVNEIDLEWITTGCYILGTGGGGSPYSSMVRLRQMLRSGAIVRVVNPVDLADDSLIGCGGGAGSPTVGIEKLSGDEMLEAQRELAAICDKAPTYMIAVEIGGMNGLQSMHFEPVW
jgi:hypothetical protein